MLALYTFFSLLQAQQKFTVSGTISGPEGPLTGAQVGFLAADNSGTTLEDFEVTTDADGHFSGQVSESFLKLAVEPPEGMDLWPEELTDINVSEDLTVRLTLSQAVTVSGRVALPENPAGDPRIQLWSLTKDRQYETLSQDEIFEIEVPADRYSIEAVYGACLGQLGNHCVRVNVDASRGDVEGITIAWSEQLQPALLVDPPRAALISVSDPDESGIAVVAGDPGAAAGLSTIAIVNLQTGQRSLTTSDADGSFAGTMFAPPGSHILVKHDPTGRYLVPGDLQISFEFPPGTSLYVPPSPSAAGIPLAATSIADGGPGLLNADPQEVKALGIRDPGQLWVSGTINSRQWNPGESISLNGKAVLYSKNLVTKPDLSAVTVTGKIYLERLFDGQGKQVQNRREFMSHIMTPTGLPLESSGDFSFVLRPLGSWEADSLEWVDEGRVEGNWHLDLPVPEDVPAGIYRVYFDLRGEGVPNENRHFGVFPALARTGEKPGSLVVQVGSPQPPRLTWALGSNEFSNGSRGSVAVQDRGRFQIASNVIINTNEFILPMQDPRTGESVKCRLEPFVPMVSSAHARIPLPPRIPFKFPSGSLQVRVIKPDGGVDRLESTPFAQSMSRSPVSPGGHPISGFSNHVTDFYQLTTLDPRFEYSFTQYGNHQVVMTGTIEDLWGTVYEGGGTYEVVVGETLDLESAVVAGTPFEVGDVFSPGVAIRPAVAADVEVRFKLLIHSDPTASVERVIRGRANRFGYFSPSHEPIVLTGPGEYRVDITARYEDELGVLGSNEGEFFLYVVEKDARDLGVDVPRASFVQPALGPIQIPLLPGEEPPDALEVHFTTVMPGFLLEEGTMSASPSTGLVYSYDAPGLHQDFPNLDLQDRDNRTGADTIVMSFLLSSDKGGRRVYQARQLVLHGEELLALPHSLAPTINLVSPTDASAGTRIQITGTRFLGGDLAVLFNGVSGIDIVVVDGSTILVTVPELPSAGPVTITVATDEGSVRLTDGLVVEKAAFGLANLLFTQFANGEIRAFAAADWEAQQGSIPNRTRIILINNSDEADSGVLRFRDAAGNPIQVQIDGVAADTVSYSLLPWSTTEVETDGTGDLQTGTIEVISGRGEESSLEGTEAFEILGNFVSVASSPRRSSQQLYVSVTETENTGVALLNPDQQNAVTLDAALLDSHNEEKAEKEIVLQGGQQLVAFVDQADLLPTSSRLNQEIFKVA